MQKNDFQRTGFAVMKKASKHQKKFFWKKNPSSLFLHIYLQISAQNFVFKLMGLEIFTFWWFYDSEKLFFSTKLLIKCKRQKIKRIPHAVLKQRGILRHYNIWINSLCYNIYLWTGFFSQQVNQQYALEWFLPLMCKEHTLSRSANPVSRNHSTFHFDEEEKIDRYSYLTFWLELTRQLFLFLF